MGPVALADRTKPKPARGTFNGKLVFYSDRHNVRGFNIWTMNADGSSPARLTDDRSRTDRLPGFVSVYDSDPVWSPDGTKIAFISNRDSLFAIYIMNADGSNAHLVTSAADLVTNRALDPSGLAWSPAGDKIAFSAGVRMVFGMDKPSVNIYTVNIDGRELTRLTNEGSSGSPTWSPDGKQIAFSSKRESDRSFKIWVMNVDGSNQRRLTDNATSSPAFGDNSAPAWSPDGKKILFSGYSNFNGTRNCGVLNCAELLVMNADGSNIEALTSDPNRDGGYVARWSPDGTKIVATVSFVTRVDRSNGITHTGIVVMNADGSNAVTISHRSERHFIDGVADWQPVSAPAIVSSSILGFSAASYSASGDAGRFTVTVKRTGSLNEAASFSYALQDEAMIRNRYTPVLGRLGFAAGEASKELSISLGDRAILPGSQSYKVILSDNEGNATFIGGIREATVTVFGKDSSPPPRNPLDDAKLFR
jgi:Tol biopolymer transport system component